MIVSSLLYFVLLFWEHYAILQSKDSLKKKNLEFVEHLKHNLRRNNDHYADIKRHSNDTQVYDNKGTGSFIPKSSKNIRPTLLKHSLPEFSARRTNKNIDVRDKLIDKIRRRVNHALLSKESKHKDSPDNNPQRRAAITALPTAVSSNADIAPISYVPPMNPFWKNPNKIIPIIPEQIKSFSNKSNEFNRPSISSLLLVSTTAMMKVTAVNDKQKKKKKKKLEKFKKFVDKNKGLLKDFISSKMADRTTMMLTTRPRLRVWKGMNENELRKAMQDAVSGLRGKSLEDLPNAELLDMAPAKGGRIHHKRLKGRLCHRHVLVPEGPKYDSAGRAYLPARARPLGATRAPRLLLPRCCNCCRKSVLGCT